MSNDIVGVSPVNQPVRPSAWLGPVGQLMTDEIYSAWAQVEPLLAKDYVPLYGGYALYAAVAAERERWSRLAFLWPVGMPETVAQWISDHSPEVVPRDQMQRVDKMGGHVCLTCIDRKLGEFGYAAPQEPLTDQQIWDAVDHGVVGGIGMPSKAVAVARAIEAAHGIHGPNTGKGD